MRVEVISTTAAYECRSRCAICREKCHSKLSGSLHGIKLPGILSVVHLLLVGFGLPAGQIREHARKDNLHKGACSVNAWITNCHQRLQQGIIEQIATTHALDFLASVYPNNGIPMCRVYHCLGTRLWTKAC